MTVGSVDYLLKPFSTENLIDAILKAIKKIKIHKLKNITNFYNIFSVPIEEELP